MTAIRSTDSDAIAQLQAKLEQLKKFQQQMKDANKIIRKNLTDGQKVEEIIKLGISENVARKILVPDFAQRVGFADFRLQNNNAEIRRVKKRIEELQQRETFLEKADSEEEYPELGLKLVRNKDFDRLQLVFDEKPDKEVRSLLRRRSLATTTQ
ncbi:hypothetical protein [Nostoc linckia]|uniref:hypothetical protein n=1 Tax=Nostoc linckia TaxID=92942 RepID=UPI000BFFCE1C|nr:hypothetical protein [Nostoc linckia]